MEAFKNIRLVDRVTAIVMVLAIIAVIFSPEAHAQSGNVYGNGQAQIISPSEEGVVMQVAIKRSEPSWRARTGGATVGGLIGAMLGNSVDTQLRAAANILGATLGGFAGERVVNAAFATEAQEIVIGLKDPKTGYLNRVITVVQPHPFDAVAPNDQVFVINSAGTVRVIKRNLNVALTSQR